MAVQMVGQVELFPAAWVRTDLRPSFPVDEVDVILTEGKASRETAVIGLCRTKEVKMSRFTRSPESY